MSDSIDPVDLSAVQAMPRLFMLRQSWISLPRLEKSAVLGGATLILIAGIIACTATGPKRAVHTSVDTVVTVPVAVKDRWEDLGVYMKQQRASQVAALQAPRLSAEEKAEAARIAAIRTQLRAPSLPQPVAIVLPPKPDKKKIAASNPDAAKAVAATAEARSSLISDGARETLAMMEALKAALKDVGLNPGKTGFSNYKE